MICPTGAIPLDPDISEHIKPLIGAGENELIVCGMALGHADQAALVNTFRTPRVESSAFTTFVD